jgi:signal transduction histidine kinase
LDNLLEEELPNNGLERNDQLMDTPSRPDKPLLPQAGETQGVLFEDMETLMHVISHDLRAPIVTIQGFCQELTMACNRLKTLFEEEAMSDAVRKNVNPLVTQDIPRNSSIYSARANGDSMGAIGRESFDNEYCLLHGISTKEEGSRLTYRRSPGLYG